MSIRSPWRPLVSRSLSQALDVLREVSNTDGEALAIADAIRGLLRQMLNLDAPGPTATQAQPSEFFQESLLLIREVLYQQSQLISQHGELLNQTALKKQHSPEEIAEIAKTVSTALVEVFQSTIGAMPKPTNKGNN